MGFFLADYLKRKKQLVKRTEIKKEGVLFFEDPITSEIYSIADVFDFSRIFRFS